MDKPNEQFTPETVDEQVDDLLESQLPTLPEDAQIIQSLHRLYSEDAVTLDHVWQRLGLDKHTSFTDAFQQAEISQGRTAGQARNIPYERNRRMFTGYHNNSFKRQLGRSLMAIAAVIIATLLIGSMLWLSHIVNPSTQVGASSAQSTLSQVSRQTDQQQIVQTPSGVYVGGADGIARIDTQTGKQLWKYSYPKLKLPELLHTGKLITRGNTIYANLQSFEPSVKSAVQAINAQTGKLIWSYPLPNASLSDLTISNKTLYAGAQNTIYVLDATNGTQQATYKMNGGAVETLSASNGTLYIGASNGLHALNLSNGKQLWYNAISGNQVDITTPHIVNDVLYTAINNLSKPTATVAAFKTSTGGKIWQSDNIQSEVFDIAVANNKVFVGTMTATSPFKGGMRAYDAQNGKLLWNTSLDGAVEWAPAIDNSVVYVSASADYPKPEEVAALNIADGSVKWKAQVATGTMTTTPVVVNGVVYESTGDNKNSGTTTALKTTDGSQVWAASSPSPYTLLVVG